MSGGHRDGGEGMAGDAKEGDDCDEFHVVVGAVVVGRLRFDALKMKKSCSLWNEFCFMS